VTSGARLGELAGLFWSDFDFGRQVMHIQRSLVTGHGKQTFESPKTKGSRRSVGLTKKATRALLRHRERLAQAGFSVVGDALVFTNTIGGPLNPSHFTQRHFKRLLRNTGLPNTTWHAATRHTCTCILLLEKSLALDEFAAMRYVEMNGTQVVSVAGGWIYHRDPDLPNSCGGLGGRGAVNPLMW
jgi:integrase